MGANVFILTFLCVASRHLLISAWFNCAGEVHKQLKLSSENLGIIDMAFLITYATGNFIFGILGDKYHQKNILCICSSLSCAVYSTIILLSYFQSLSFPGFAILFAMLGLFQSAIWPTTVAIMSQEYPHEVRGKIIGIWSINSAVGDICGYFISAMLIELFSSWVLISLIGLIQFSLVIFFTFMMLKSHENIETKPQIKVLDALKLPTVINYCACYGCMKLLHMAILIWIPYYMEVKLRINIEYEGVLMILYSVGGVVGSIISGILSDKVSDRSFILMVMLLISFPIITLLGLELGASIYFSFAISFIIGMMIGGGSNLLSAVVAADMCDLETHFEAKSTLTGLVDACGGIGASLGQFLVIFIQIGLLQEYSWSAVFGVMLANNALGMLALLPVVYKAYKKRFYREFYKDEKSDKTTPESK
ncbi:hypothetical protein SteCoe_5280 [Stentor coeruleus]|uniref:Major facilitator superfamily (MFS) profile domain-containing protein n=1 Tax=Stentor coeruleus TaxID=5963 RepID=A0A1R2CSU1_9CILI|nr:hypothetical protein SteCoe_5280 [Stentor coeruleus]